MAPPLSDYLFKSRRSPGAQVPILHLESWIAFRHPGPEVELQPQRTRGESRQKCDACVAHGHAVLSDTPLAIVDSSERTFRGSTLPEYYCAELDMSERTGWTAMRSRKSRGCPRCRFCTWDLGFAFVAAAFRGGRETLTGEACYPLATACGREKAR
jgi:hypothetical protein